jgi:hypothetical protein
MNADQSSFTAEKPILTTDEYPSDMDTTSIGLMMTQPDDHVFNSVMDEMLRYTSQDGIQMVGRRFIFLSFYLLIAKPRLTDLL